MCPLAGSSFPASLFQIWGKTEPLVWSESSLIYILGLFTQQEFGCTMNTEWQENCFLTTADIWFSTVSVDIAKFPLGFFLCGLGSILLFGFVFVPLFGQSTQYFKFYLTILSMTYTFLSSCFIRTSLVPFFDGLILICVCADACNEVTWFMHPNSWSQVLNRVYCQSQVWPQTPTEWKCEVLASGFRQG